MFCATDKGCPKKLSIFQWNSIGKNPSMDACIHLYSQRSAPTQPATVALSMNFPETWRRQLYIPIPGSKHKLLWDRPRVNPPTWNWSTHNDPGPHITLLFTSSHDLFSQLRSAFRPTYVATMRNLVWYASPDDYHITIDGHTKASKPLNNGSIVQLVTHNVISQNCSNRAIVRNLANPLNTDFDMLLLK